MKFPVFGQATIAISGSGEIVEEIEIIELNASFYGQCFLNW